MAYMNKANSLSALGDNRRAVAFHDRAIEIRERLVNQEGQSELGSSVAYCYKNKALVLTALGDDRGAVALYDKAAANCRAVPRLLQRSP
jgi:tetratricopeptide (TPR) repeat protein